MRKNNKSFVPVKYYFALNSALYIHIDYNLMWLFFSKLERTSLKFFSLNVLINQKHKFYIDL